MDREEVSRIVKEVRALDVSLLIISVELLLVLIFVILK